MIIVSACLAGINCKYSGKSNTCSDIVKLVSMGEAIPVCPEQLGGLSTPRPAAEICGGTGADVIGGRAFVKRVNGEDVTCEFIKGAEEVFRIAGLTGAKKAIMKAKSPSCGVGFIYDGTFEGRLIKGNGVTAEMLLRNGIETLTEDQYLKSL
ncbi:MAG TPA: DUF523 domain-containing protein [Clostridia bacterium]